MFRRVMTKAVWAAGLFGLLAAGCQTCHPVSWKGGCNQTACGDTQCGTSGGCVARYHGPAYGGRYPQSRPTPVTPQPVPEKADPFIQEAPQPAEVEQSPTTAAAEICPSDRQPVQLLGVETFRFVPKPRTR